MLLEGVGGSLGGHAHVERHINQMRCPRHLVDEQELGALERRMLGRRVIDLDEEDLLDVIVGVVEGPLERGRPGLLVQAADQVRIAHVRLDLDAAPERFDEQEAHRRDDDQDEQGDEVTMRGIARDIASLEPFTLATH